MKYTLITIILIVTIVLPASAQVIQYEIDPSFNSGDLLKRGSVNDVCILNDGTLLVSGIFSLWDSPAENVSLFSSSGALLMPLFVANAFRRVANYKNGYIIYGQTGVSRFDFPNQSSPAFQYEWGKPVYNVAPTRMAHNILIMPNDNIIVAGRFHTDSTLIGTAEVLLGLRQLSMIDSTGAPVPDFPMIRCAQPLNAYIRSINKLSTGEYLVSGMFNEIEGHPYAKLAKLNPDFSVNTDFIPVFGTTGTAVDITLIDSQDRIWLNYGANITLLDYPDYSSRLVRLLPDGSLDEGFDPPVFSGYLSGTYENPADPTQTTAAVLEDEDGTFILSGQFTEINGEHYRRLAKITDSGELIPGAMQSLGPDSSAWGPPWQGSFGPVMSAKIVSVNKLPDGKLMIGGEFSSFGGEPYSCLVRLQPSGFVGTDDSNQRGQLSLWPNPSSNYIQVALPSTDEPINHIEILDLQGRSVLSRNLQHSIDSRIDIQYLPPGLYLIKASGSTGMYTQKLVVQ